MYKFYRNSSKAWQRQGSLMNQGIAGIPGYVTKIFQDAPLQAVPIQDVSFQAAPCMDLWIFFSGWPATRL
jgi:hypothetical protein